MMKRVQAPGGGVVKASRARRTAHAVPAHITFVQPCGAGQPPSLCPDATLAAWLAGQLAGPPALPPAPATRPGPACAGAPPAPAPPADDALSSSDSPYGDAWPSERDQEADSAAPPAAARERAPAPTPAPLPADSSPTASSMGPAPGAAGDAADAADGPPPKRARRVSFDDGAPQVFAAAPPPERGAGEAPPLGLPAEDFNAEHLELIAQLLGPENAPSVARLKRRLELLPPGLPALAPPVPAA
jgi:hypothetical protein